MQVVCQRTKGGCYNSELFCRESRNMGGQVDALRENHIFQRPCNARKCSTVLAGLHMPANEHLRYYFSVSPFLCSRQKTLHREWGTSVFQSYPSQGMYHSKLSRRKFFSSLFVPQRVMVFGLGQFGLELPPVKCWLLGRKKEKDSFFFSFTLDSLG